MSVTDNFAKLKEQVEKADRSVKAAAEQNQAEIQAKVDEARRDADERAAELRAKSKEAAREGESNWREMQADLEPPHRACSAAHGRQERGSRREGGRP